MSERTGTIRNIEVPESELRAALAALEAKPLFKPGSILTTKFGGLVVVLNPRSAAASVHGFQPVHQTIPLDHLWFSPIVPHTDLNTPVASPFWRRGDIGEMTLDQQKVQVRENLLRIASPDEVAYALRSR